MIIDSKNIAWTPNENRTEWSSSDGRMIVVNPEMVDEQVKDAINAVYDLPVSNDPQVVYARIAELEAQLAALLSRL